MKKIPKRFESNILFLRIPIVSLILVTLMACDGGINVSNDIDFSTADVKQVGDIRSLDLPGGSVQSLPESVPEQAEDKVELGRLLFWDPVLSAERDVACASCHLPERGYTDNLEISIGVGGVGQGDNRMLGHLMFADRNAQTVLNTVFNGIDENGNFDPANAPMFWDGRANSLEEQALLPIQSRTEMRGDTIAELDILPAVVGRLNDIPEYRQQFLDAYQADMITEALLADALATFQRTLVANNSDFDRWMRGDETAMTNNQLVGMREFASSGCVECHSGPMFSDFEMHVLGVGVNDKRDSVDEGDGNFGFRTPSLRNLNLTFPYMHNGTQRTLNNAVGFYDNTRSRNPSVPNSALDPDFRRIGGIDGERRTVLIDFLNSLADDNFDKKVPESVPSGLTPGGNIN